VTLAASARRPPAIAAGGRPLRVAVVVSHPIQYYAPLYRALAAAPELDLTVLFAAKIGLEVRRDVKMGVDMAWNTDLTGGYRHRFLAGAERIEKTAFFEIDNPDVGAALAQADPQVLLLHGYAAMTNLKALAWARLRGRPVVMISDSTIDSSAGRLRRLFKRVVGRRLLGQFRAFLTLGDRGEAYLARYGVERRRLFRTPAMIDAQFWRARQARAARRAETRRALGVADGAVVLLSVGKLYASKRLGDVIDALAGLKRAGLERPVRLVVAGEGEQRPALEAAAAAAGVDVLFLGFVNIDALPDLYAAADMLVHAAEVEQYGMVILEAAVLGLPLIVSDRIGAVGPSSIARPGVNALVYPCADAPALGRAILELARDPARRAAFAEASLRLSEDHRGPTSVAGVIAACRFALSLDPR
jgi:glycosyltransferase involved in cell wall biosynthesis